MSWPLSLVLAFLLTEAIEIPVCFIWGMRRRDLVFVLLANLLTNPVVNVLYALAFLYTPIPRAVSIAVLEIAAVLTEWLVYRSATGAKRLFLVSLTANAASYGAGLLITAFLL
jgi:hypothetical protein